MASPNIRIDIASEFRDRGFKRASRATTGLERQFKSLGRTVIAVFSARQIIRFTQESVRAFAAEDRAVRALSGTLNNLGLAFQGANVESFVSEMQRVTAVSDDQLRPALQQLATTTLDVQEAQKLLGLALDISAGTGKDLSTIVNGLSRAYLRDVSALARLNIGLTAAQLSTMSFAEAQAALTERFSGQAAIAADSYQGKISKLGIAFDEAQEIIGQKFIKSLENMANGNFDKVIETIGNAAVMVGNGFIRASYGVQKLKAALGGNFDQVKKLQEAMNLELAGGFGVRGRVPAAQLQRQSQQQSTILRRLENERKKAAAAENKRIREQQSLRRAGTVFDMENIQIVAALQGRISDDQRLRLTALLAINQQNADAAEKLSLAILATNAAALQSIGVTMKAGDSVDDVIKKIINSQAQLALVGMGLATLPKAKNPFEDWTSIIAAILADIGRVSAAINQIPKYNPVGANVINPSTVSSTGTSTVAVAPKTSFDVIAKEHAEAAAAVIATATSPQNTSVIVDELTKRQEMARLATNMAYTGLAEFKAKEYGDIIVQVNVQGNVTTETDLVNAITDQLYQNQKTGKGLLFSSVAI
jgi:hypothetical protein